MSCIANLFRRQNNENKNRSNARPIIQTQQPSLNSNQLTLTETPYKSPIEIEIERLSENPNNKFIKTYTFRHAFCENKKNILQLDNLGLTHILDNICGFSLDKFDCSNNLLEELPSRLPYTLSHLCCAENKLISLPQLRSMLKILDCSGNRLTTIPKLPRLLSLLYCNRNNLSELPEIQNIKLDEIICDNNKLTKLPLLPTTIYLISFSNNYITGIAEDNIKILSSIDDVFCDNNPFIEGYEDISEYIGEYVDNKNVFYI